MKFSGSSSNSPDQAAGLFHICFFEQPGFLPHLLFRADFQILLFLYIGIYYRKKQKIFPYIPETQFLKKRRILGWEGISSMWLLRNGDFGLGKDISMWLLSFRAFEVPEA